MKPPKFPSEDPKLRRKWKRLNRKRHEILRRKYSEEGMAPGDAARYRRIVEKMEAIEDPYHQIQLQHIERFYARVVSAIRTVEIEPAVSEDTQD